MLISNKFLFIGLIFCFASSVLNAPSDDKTEALIVKLFETTTTTEEPSTSTSKPDVAKVFNFTIPQNTSLPACLRARFAASFNITYLAQTQAGEKYNATQWIELDNVVGYMGMCNDSFNFLSVNFHNDWEFVLNYTLSSKSQYVLNTVRLDYVVDQTTFPNAIDLGKKVAGLSNLNEFSANKGNSYKCWSKTTIALDEVKVEFRDYQAEPFLDGKKDFDTAVECAADQTGTSELVPIIVGTALAVLVVFVLIAYIVGRRKHRPGYQQV